MGGSQDEEIDRARDLREIRAAIESLERRLARVEAAVPLAHAEQRSADKEAPPPRDTERSRLIFTRLALICFSLVGALLLRTMTRQAWLSAKLGTILGLTYCCLLLVGPFVAVRARGAWRHAETLALCGGLLAPLIVLEAVHRSQVMGPATAAATLGALALVGGILGFERRSAWIAAVVPLAQVVAVAALGLTPDGAAWRGGVMVPIVGGSLWLASRRGWSFLRPLLMLPVAAILASGVLVTARRTELPPTTAPSLVLSGLGVWLCVAINYAIRASVLTRFELWSFPLATLCAYGMGAFYRLDLALPAALACSTVLLLVAARLPTAKEGAPRVASALLATGALLPGLSLPWIDASGLALAGCGLVVQRIGLAIGSRLGLRLSQLLILASAVVALTKGGLLAPSTSALASRLIAGAVLSVLLLVHYWTEARRGEGVRTTAWLAPVSLACSTLVAYCCLRLVTWVFFAGEAALALSQTVLVAALSIVLFTVGRRTSLTGMSALGLIGTMLLGAKVVLRDLVTLEGAYLVGSVLTLGLAALGTSLIFRQKTGPRNEGDRGGVG